jgi:SSS family solute:Na+ symporter
MFLIVLGLLVAIGVLVAGLPPEVGIIDALNIAGSTGRLQTFDFRFDLSNRWTFWSGTIAALFLFLSYFGTDQSQVQRYLTARSVDEARVSLFMSAYWKIPLQVLVLLIGVMMFVFYIFTTPPMLFNPAHEQTVQESARGPEYAALERRFAAAIEQRRHTALQLAAAERSGDGATQAFAGAAFKSWNDQVQVVRQTAIALVKDVTGDRSYDDVNFVFPTWMTTQLPVGLVGLMLAAIFAAAMSTISAELASLSTATVIDFYRRWIRQNADERHLLNVSRLATGFWGLFASVVAIWSVELGSLIEVVNRYGSFFYGSILGVFLLAIGWKRANGHGAFVGLIAGMIAVGYVDVFTNIEFLWLNIVGAITVFVVGAVVSAAAPQKASRPQRAR